MTWVRRGSWIGLAAVIAVMCVPVVLHRGLSVAAAPAQKKDVRADNGCPQTMQWPPHPENMVWITTQNEDVIEPGGEFLFYEVPPDQWLVITGYQQPAQYSRVIKAVGDERVVIMTWKAGTVLTADHYDPGLVDNRSPLGVPVEPGARILIESLKTEANLRLLPGEWVISGYLVDAK